MLAMKFPKPVKPEKKPRKRLRRVAKRAKRVQRLRDPQWRKEVAALGYCGAPFSPLGCQGDIVCAHRDQGKGVGLKTDDDLSWPQCWKHHEEWGRNKGVYEGWDRDRRRCHEEHEGRLARMLVEAKRKRLGSESDPGASERGMVSRTGG